MTLATRILSAGWAWLLILIGTGLLAWIGYNVFVEMQPAAEGRNPLVPAVFGAVLVVTGIVRLRRRRD